MQTMIDFDAAPVFAVPTAGPTGVREGMLIEGPQGWGEFSPPAQGTDVESGRWLTAATEAGTIGWPDPVRGRVPVAVSVPAVDPAVAGELAARSGCRTAQVEVGAGPDARDTLADDLARVAAVRAALGADGVVRVAAGGRWDVDTAVRSIRELIRAAGDLQFVQQPCRTRTEVAAVRARVDVPIAVEVTAWETGDPAIGTLTEVADIAVLGCAPLGGVRRSLRAAEVIGLPCAVASDAATSIGLAAAVALAGALPELDFACALGLFTDATADLVHGPRRLIPVAGQLPVAPSAAAPDAGLLARYAMTDPARINWWRDRLRAALRPTG